jgi:hypothetical protein
MFLRDRYPTTPWKSGFPVTTNETFEALDMGNRYFTDRRDINGDTPISFGTEIDPHNILTNALSNEFVHLQENKVEYYEAQQGSDSVIR